MSYGELPVSKKVKEFEGRLENDLMEIYRRYDVNVKLEKSSEPMIIELSPPLRPIVIDVVPYIVEEEKKKVEVEEEETPQIKKVESPTLKKTEELEPDQIIFINRTVDALAGNLEGYPKDAQQRAMEQKSEMRRELTEVFQGKRKYEDWFNKTKTRFGLHTYTFTKMLYDCLEGLRSPDAKALRSDYYQALRRLGAGTP